MYIRVIPKTVDGTVWRASEARGYKLEYLTETADKTELSVSSSLQLVSKVNPNKDQAVLKTSGNGAGERILYTVDGTDVALTKAAYADVQKLSKDNESTGLVTYNDNQYIRINGL